MITVKAIKVTNIDRRIRDLEMLIKRETNTKEKTRLVDEQAALKLTLRVMAAENLSVIIKNTPATPGAE